jgi:hypothetical protein
MSSSRAAIAEKQLGALQDALRTHKAAVRTNGISVWTGKIKRLRKEQRDLKKKFQQHCEKDSNEEKQSHRARRKAHEKRAEEKGENFDSDSLDSEDSQASLLDDLQHVQSELLLSKNELNLLQVFVSTEEAPDGVTGSDISVDNQAKGN